MIDNQNHQCYSSPSDGLHEEMLKLEKILDRDLEKDVSHEISNPIKNRFEILDL